MKGCRKGYTLYNKKKVLYPLIEIYVRKCNTSTKRLHKNRMRYSNKQHGKLARKNNRQEAVTTMLLELQNYQKNV